MTDDDLNLVSAYLDGELDDESRARVEADPDLLAEVEQLRQVRAVLGDVEAPPISVRERHLAAALAAWDRLPEAQRRAGDPTPGSLVSAPPPSSLDQRRRARRRWNQLAVAAAAVVVVGGGVALATTGAFDGDSDDSAAPDDTAATEQLDAMDELAVEAGNEFGSVDASTSPAADRAAGESTEALTESDAGAAADSVPLGGPEAPPPDATLDILESRDDLAAFAAFALEVPASAATATANTEAPTDGDEFEAEEAAEALPDCGFDIVAGVAVYRGTEVVVGIDVDRDLAIAYLAADCSEVERARLP